MWKSIQIYNISPTAHSWFDWIRFSIILKWIDQSDVFWIYRFACIILYRFLQRQYEITSDLLQYQANQIP